MNHHVMRGDDPVRRVGAVHGAKATVVDAVSGARAVRAMCVP